MSREAFEAWWDEDEVRRRVHPQTIAWLAYQAAERTTARRCWELCEAEAECSRHDGRSASDCADAIAREFGLDAPDAQKG